jgi:hypothetical protein
MLSVLPKAIARREFEGLAHYFDATDDCSPVSN